MALSIWYDDPVEGPVDVTGYVKYGIGQIKLQTKAEQGAVATSEIVVQDPYGIFDFQGLRPIYVNESECEFERLYTGWIWSKDYTRGDYYRTGAARQVTVQVQDLNHIIWQKVMAGNDTDRPAETDVERVQWLLSTGEAGLIFDTTTYVHTDDPTAMDANPDAGYNGQMFQNVIDDCAQQSGKNYYMLDIFDYGLDAYENAIWYGSDDLDDFVSEATISNILSEVDNVTVFWGDLAANLNKEPSRLFSGIFGNFDGGYTYQSNATTIANFGNRDTTASWPNIKTHAKAVARANRQLVALNVEEQAVTVVIYSLLPSQANVFRAGMRVNGVKFTHFPGWEDGRDCRIVTKTLTDQAEGLYSVELELLPIGAGTPAGSCTTAVASMTSYDSGDETNYPGGGSPLSIAVGLTPATFPAVILTSAGLINTFEDLGHDMTTSGGYTDIGGYKNVGGFDYNHILTSAAYKALAAGSPGNIGFTWTGARAFHDCLVAAALATAATAPVQVATNVTASVVLASDPTPGHILIAFRQFQPTGSSGLPVAPTGFTQIVASQAFDGGVSRVTVDICVRCVQAGDGKTWAIGSGAAQMALTLAEWAIT